MKRILAGIALWSALQAMAAVEVNTATEAELDGVKGLGPSSTARILKARVQGPFQDWADFMRRVKGIKPAKAEQLSKDGLTVAEKPYVAAP
jgi:competence protein ComEA